MKGALRYGLVEHAGGLVLTALMSSLRVHVENDEAYRELMAPGKPVILVLWHGRLLPLGFIHRGQDVVGLASRSADGEYIARVLQRWGFEVVRGSSSGGGDIAFRQLIRVVHGGRSVAVTPDGPRGPREKFKPGVIQLARITGAPLVPVAIAASRAWWFVGWDRFMVPKPFARLAVKYGDPITVARDADPATLAAHAEAELMRLMRHVESRVA
jgi:lysophospholipid acyltransferase (LPLAT)-like uncharacterized protein